MGDRAPITLYAAVDDIGFLLERFFGFDAVDAAKLTRVPCVNRPGVVSVNIEEMNYGAEEEASTAAALSDKPFILEAAAGDTYRSFTGIPYRKKLITHVNCANDHTLAVVYDVMRDKVVGLSATRTFAKRYLRVYDNIGARGLKAAKADTATADASTKHLTYRPDARPASKRKRVDKRKL